MPDTVTLILTSRMTFPNSHLPQNILFLHYQLQISPEKIGGIGRNPLIKGYLQKKD